MIEDLIKKVSSTLNKGGISKMKFTKLTSATLLGVSVLSAFIVPGTSFAATQEHNADANGGIELPQHDTTTAGISFGDNNPSGNTGYLRLQMVPHVLDFGNHEQFFAQYPMFTADGKNYGKNDNNRHPNYKNGDTNETAILNTQDEKLADVAGKAWATVVDKQVTRDATKFAAPNTSVSGTWTLSVKPDGPLQAKNDQGNVINGEDINDATLSFKDTAYGRTLDIYTLTSEDQDKDFANRDKTKDDDKDLDTSAITSNFSLPLTSGGKYQLVATAADTQGEGADVFGWNKDDIQLTMPTTSVVKNAVYESNLTWELATGIA